VRRCVPAAEPAPAPALRALLAGAVEGAPSAEPRLCIAVAQPRPGDDCYSDDCYSDAPVTCQPSAVEHSWSEPTTIKLTSSQTSTTKHTSAQPSTVEHACSQTSTIDHASI